MTPASANLNEVELQKAIPSEQTALQMLQRAEASFRDIQAARSQGGNGGGSRTSRDIAELYELEMDLSKSKYETEKEVSQDQDSHEKSIDEALEKLKELARRQEQLAEQRQQQQQPQSNADRWRQEQLRREAEELRKRLQQLAQQQMAQNSQASNQSSQSSNQSGQQSDDSSDRVSRARGNRVSSLRNQNAMVVSQDRSPRRRRSTRLSKRCRRCVMRRTGTTRAPLKKRAETCSRRRIACNPDRNRRGQVATLKSDRAVREQSEGDRERAAQGGSRSAHGAVGGQRCG